MKKTFMFVALLAVVCFTFAGTAKADSTTAGGIVYTFTNLGGGDVGLTIATSGATSSGTLSSFAVQFTAPVSLVSGPTGWSFNSLGPSNASGCSGSGAPGTECFSGPGIAVPDGTLNFVFKVSGTVPLSTHIQAFQSQGGLAISNDVGVGPPPSVPEPASLTLLGLGLAGVPFLRRKRS